MFYANGGNVVFIVVPMSKTETCILDCIFTKELNTVEPSFNALNFRLSLIQRWISVIPSQ
jgi:hypothetical protein